MTPTHTREEQLDQALRDLANQAASATYLEGKRVADFCADALSPPAPVDFDQCGNTPGHGWTACRRDIGHTGPCAHDREPFVWSTETYPMLDLTGPSYEPLPDGLGRALGTVRVTPYERACTLFLAAAAIALVALTIAGLYIAFGGGA